MSNRGKLPMPLRYVWSIPRNAVNDLSTSHSGRSIGSARNSRTVSAAVASSPVSFILTSTSSPGARA